MQCMQGSIDWWTPQGHCLLFLWHKGSSLTDWDPQHYTYVHWFNLCHTLWVRNYPHLWLLPHKLQNASARLIRKSSQQEHTKPLLKALHWLSISDCITYKLSCMCYSSVTASTPQYLADLLQIYTPSCTLRSTTDTCKLKIPLFKKKYSGQRFFSFQGPVTRNNLPFSIATHKHTSHLSHSWKPTCFPKPSNITQFLMLFVFDFQSWDVSMVHVLLHCMSGLHWWFQDACMFACALLLTLDRLVYACFMYWFWCPFLFWIVKCFEPIKFD